LEEVLAAELVELGIPEVEPLRGAVSFGGGLPSAYRACLWSRVASRVLWPLAQFFCPHADALYDGVADIPWTRHLHPRDTLAVDFVGGSEEIRHSVFGARKTKDAICDRMRFDVGVRPDVDLARPDLRVYVRLAQDVATVGIDLSGEALHLRGAGRSAGAAPLKETLAAALLRMAGWPELAAEGAPFVDPLCGSGTLLLEAAGMALGRAPGLTRPRWGFQGWQGHDAEIWRRLRAEAEQQARTAAETRELPPITGYDADPRMVSAARGNAAALGLDEHVRVARQPLQELHPKHQREAVPRGLLLTNPPYGARLGETDELVELYQDLGDVWRWRFLGWEAWMITGSKRLAQSVGLRPARRIPVWNGGIDCRLLRFPIGEEAPRGKPRWRRGPEAEAGPSD